MSAFVRNMWYVAAWSHELSAGKLLTRTLLGDKVVIYRASGKGVVALADRCPHRAAPLSLGQCEGENLRCMYHGLLFNPAGECIEMPHQARPPQFNVRSYPVIEQEGLIWIWCGDPAKASSRQPLPCPWLASQQWRGKLGYMHFKANYQLIADNLLDFSHSAYVHRTTFGSPAVATVKQSVERVGEQVRIVRHLTEIDPVPFHRAAGAGAGKVDMWHEYDWICPGILCMDTGSAPTGTGGLEGKRDGVIRFRHLSLLTPETDGTTHYFYTQLRNFALDDASMDDVIFNNVSAAFSEDKAMIEAQQIEIDRCPDEALATMAGDRGLVEARRIVQEMLASERPAQERPVQN